MFKRSNRISTQYVSTVQAPLSHADATGATIDICIRAHVDSNCSSGFGFRVYVYCDIATTSRCEIDPDGYVFGHAQESRHLIDCHKRQDNIRIALSRRAIKGAKNMSLSSSQREQKYGEDTSLLIPLPPPPTAGSASRAMLVTIYNVQRHS